MSYNYCGNKSNLHRSHHPPLLLLFVHPKHGKPVANNAPISEQVYLGSRMIRYARVIKCNSVYMSRSFTSSSPMRDQQNGTASIARPTRLSCGRTRLPFLPLSRLCRNPARLVCVSQCRRKKEDARAADLTPAEERSDISLFVQNTQERRFVGIVKGFNLDADQ